MSHLGDCGRQWEAAAGDRVRGDEAWPSGHGGGRGEMPARRRAGAGGRGRTSDDADFQHLERALGEDEE